MDCMSTPSMSTTALEGNPRGAEAPLLHRIRTSFAARVQEVNVPPIGGTRLPNVGVGTASRDPWWESVSHPRKVLQWGAKALSRLSTPERPAPCSITLSRNPFGDFASRRLGVRVPLAPRQVSGGAVFEAHHRARRLGAGTYAALDLVR